MPWKHTVVSCHAGDGKWTLVPYKGSTYNSLLSHLSSTCLRRQSSYLKQNCPPCKTYHTWRSKNKLWTEQQRGKTGGLTPCLQHNASAHCLASFTSGHTRASLLPGILNFDFHSDRWTKQQPRRESYPILPKDVGVSSYGPPCHNRKQHQNTVFPLP